MDYIYNAPSIEQISFKLTENFIPSITQLPQPPPSCDSLDYSLSRLSIQYNLWENQEPNIPQTTPEQSCLQKQSTLKTTCADLTNLTAFKKSTKPSFRQRIVSNTKSIDNTKIKRRFSMHVLCLETPAVQKKDNKTPLHTPQPSPFRSKQQRKRSVSGKNLFSNKKTIQLELLQLQNSMKVRGIVLQSHEEREKSFMRRVIQNRSNVIHPIQQLSRTPQIWTSRRSFRIH